jgi:hypothetical protein
MKRRLSLWGPMITAHLMMLLCLCAAQAQEPVAVLSSSWQRAAMKAPKTVVPASGPAKAHAREDKNFGRNARDQRSDSHLGLEQYSTDSRSAAIEKQVEESKAPQRSDIRGYTYTASVRNQSGKTIEVIYWEYAFTEKARPENSVRRQFLCGVTVKDKATTNLTAFSTLAPSDVIDAESLSRAGESPFEERVQINRIEFSDDSVLQRSGWKFEEVRLGVERATAQPWGKDVCRAL